MTDFDLDHLQTVIDTAADWPVDTCAVGVTTATATLATMGPADKVFPLASVTKPLAAVGVVLAAQYGDLHLDEPAGPPDSTVRHLLAHASGLPMTSSGTTREPGTRRIYSNVGFEVLGELIAERTDQDMATHLAHELFDPLDMADTTLDGSPAHAGRSCVTDLLAFARELLQPALLDDDMWSDLATPQFPALDGVVPGYGRQTPCPWGLGLELKASKDPHWTGTNQPPTVCGHFGQSGTFLWIDRSHSVAAVALTDRDFGDWAVEAWQPFNTELAAALGATA